MKSGLNFSFAVFATVLITGIHGLNYADLEATKVSCPKYDSCAARSNDSSSIGRSCGCDGKCLIYNDCCIDSKNLKEMGLNSSKFICMTEQNTFDFGIYAISTCEQNWQGPAEIKNKCEVGNDLSDPLLSTPATDKRQGVTYRSRYCAECNNAVPYELTYWDISTDCHTPSSRIIESTFDDLIYNADLNEWGFTRDNVHYTCDILFKEPKSVRNNVRECIVSLIGTCPITWRRMEVKRLCEDYTAVVFDEDDFYRNPHCALCNGVSLDKLTCTGIFGRRIKPAVATMFDIDTDDGDIVGEIIPKKPSCPEGQNYDPFFNRCRELSCGLPGYTMVDGSCVNT